MANQIADNKQRVYLVLDKSLIAQIDGRAAADGSNRTAVIVEALTAYFDSGSAGDAAAVRLDAIAAKLDAIASAQGELKAQQLAQSTVIADAIKNQPIAVQQALPAPEVTDEDVIAYLREKRPDIPLNAWGEPTPPQARKKGLFGRIFG